MSIVFVGHSLKAVAVAHGTLTITSLLYGTFGPSRDSVVEEEGSSEVVRDKLAGVDKLVTDMYTGRGIGKEYLHKKESHTFVSRNISFEDPAAICVGSKEVAEAFRALHVVNPEALSPPKCVRVDQNGATWTVTYKLNQRYAGILTVRSMQVIEMQVQPAADNSHVNILKIEEQWNGVKPLGGIFWPSRRLNGILSWNLTTRFISNSSS